VLIHVLFLATCILSDLDPRDLFLLVDDLLAHAIFLLNTNEMMPLLLLILLGHDLGLLSLFVLR